jgi:hypothetical protein
LKFGVNERQPSAVSLTAGKAPDAIVDHLRAFAVGTL